MWQPRPAGSKPRRTYTGRGDNLRRSRRTYRRDPAPYLTDRERSSFPNPQRSQTKNRERSLCGVTTTRTSRSVKLVDDRTVFDTALVAYNFESAKEIGVAISGCKGRRRIIAMKHSRRSRPSRMGHDRPGRAQGVLQNRTSRRRYGMKDLPNLREDIAVMACSSKPLTRTSCSNMPRVRLLRDLCAALRRHLSPRRGDQHDQQVSHDAEGSGAMNSPSHTGGPIRFQAATCLECPSALHSVPGLNIAPDAARDLAA